MGFEGGRRARGEGGAASSGDTMLILKDWRMYERCFVRFRVCGRDKRRLDKSEPNIVELHIPQTLLLP